MTWCPHFLAGLILCLFIHPLPRVTQIQNSQEPSSRSAGWRGTAAGALHLAFFDGPIHKGEGFTSSFPLPSLVIPRDTHVFASENPLCGDSILRHLFFISPRFFLRNCTFISRWFRRVQLAVPGVRIRLSEIAITRP